MLSRTHLNLPNACKLMCFDRNINGNRDDKLLFKDIHGLLTNTRYVGTFSRITSPPTRVTCDIRQCGYLHSCNDLLESGFPKLMLHLVYAYCKNLYEWSCFGSYTL